jgi:uncharacterized protein YbcC (UPF0753/DUF2309 family)
MGGHDPTVADDANPRARLGRAVEHAAHLLPKQGPIGVFIHHNTLHAFEHLRFEDAVVEAGRRLHAEPFMPEAWYRAALQRGRITLDDLDAVLEQERVASGTRDDAMFDGRIGLHELRRRVLVQGLLETDDASIQWLLEEQDRGRRFLETTSLPARLAIASETTRWLGAALSSAPLGSLFADPVRGVGPYDLVRRWLGVEPRLHGIERALRDDPEACAVASLWTAAAARVHEGLPYPPPEQPVTGRWRDVLLAATTRDADELAHGVLIPAMAAFVDQGVAYWPMADRELGFFAAFRQLVLHGPPMPDPMLRETRRALAATAGADAEEVLLQTLDAMGIPPEGFDDALEAAALALPGWAGMMRRLEEEPDLAPQVCPPCRLLDFLAVRLLLDRLAAERIARQTWDYRGSLAELRGSLRLRPPLQDPRLRATFALFQLAQLAGIGAPTLRALPTAALQDVRTELERFDDVTRRRLWHLAYERRHRLDVLGALARHRRTVDPARERLPPPSLQILFCIDDRSESIRRHIEEQDPSIETFGTAGFFGLAIAFRGLDDAHHAALCPVVQQPLHEVVEQSEEDELSPLYRVRRRLFAALAQGTFRGSRNLFRGAVATLGLGLLSLVPLALRVLAPRGVTRLYARLQAMFFPRPRTRLAIRRAAEERGDIEMFPGFTVTEMADRVSRVLQDMGLVRSFAPLVAAVGHGSSSLNNPHESAYDCGACGGRRGGPNARLFAMMANDPKVRAELAARGLAIPRSTVFVGGYHDTCTDAVTWFDFEELPADASASLAGLRAAELPAHATASLARLRAAVEHARTRNAHERCRRFESAPLDAEPEVALRHVEGRAADLAEPRSECGHATNAICVFGRRGVTRGLFLDRRALLVSYDPTLDPEGEVLGRLLAAMGPVAAGINLEYLFSYVDNERYGCGTKLPHNLTGLVGVMNGHESDLRTGLPRQMVEIHEPVRLLVVCETTLELVQRALANHPAVGRLFANRWVQLALMDPHTGQLGVVEDGRLVPLPEPSDLLPTAVRSEQWYRQRRDHLPIAAVTATTRAQA